MQVSHEKFAGNLNSLPSIPLYSRPHGKEPFLFAVLSRGKRTLKSSSLGPSPNLTVQFPFGEGWITFQAR